jgi:Leucine-rich repeat (LRR) protein
MDNLGNNNRATIVKEITHIHFTALTRLHLGGNRIESVEGLARVQMTHIQVVSFGTYNDNIGRNNITSVGVIRKAAWPRL